MTMTVSKLAAAADLTADTIRYYERIGLLTEPERTPAGYRVYEEEDVDRLHFVKGAQRLGLRLNEIRELLAIRDRGLCPCGHADHMLRNRIDELDSEIESLTRLRSELVRMIEDRPNSPDSCVGEIFQIEGVRR